MRKYAIIFFILVFIAIDAMSKWFFETTFWLLQLDSVCQYASDCKYRYFPIFGEYLGFQLSHNTGIAFSLPIRGVLLQVVTLLILLGLAYHYIREEYKKNSRILDIGYALIFAGALSHTYERIFVGYVIDFISVKYFAILNFADIFISIGAILLLFAYVGEYRKHR